MSKQNLPRNREPKQKPNRNRGTVAITLNIPRGQYDLAVKRAEVTAMSMEDIFLAGVQAI